MFSAFRHQRHRQDLMCDKKGSKRGASIFNPQEFPSGASEREKGMISQRGKRNSRGESDLKFPAKSTHVSYDVALKDHVCIFPCQENKVSSSPVEKNINTVK